MSPRWYKVQQTVHPIVLDVPPVQPALVGKVLPELLVDVLRTHPPTVLAVDRVPKAGRVHDRQSQLDPLLLDVQRLFVDLGRLLDALLGVRHRPRPVQIRQEQAVDQRGLAEPALAAHHQRELEAALHRLSVHLFGQGGEADVVAFGWNETGKKD